MKGSKFRNMTKTISNPISQRHRGIDELLIEPCCAVKYYPEMETCENEIFMEGDENRDDDAKTKRSG